MVTGPEISVSQVEIRHSDVAPVLGDRVCFVVGYEDGNRSFFVAFLKNKRLPYFKKISGSSKLKKVQITNVLVNFVSVRPLLLSPNAYALLSKASFVVPVHPGLLVILAVGTRHS